jgi:predicted dehydrogenase
VHPADRALNKLRAPPLELVLVGAGGRGFHAYGSYALGHPGEVRFVAVAEPDEDRRERFSEAHGIPLDQQFRSWDELAAGPQLARAAVNTTMDRTHHRSTLALLEAGYDVLLEKPMATTPAECVELVHAAEQRGRILQICHVLRYAPFFRTIHDLVTSGRLGDIVSFEWNENLIYWHFAHSFVRGNWANSQRSGPMILTKCCHDLDLLVWMLGRPEKLASFGSLSHFRPERVGPDIPDRCTDGCPIEAECPYFAPRVYIEQDKGNWARDPVSLDHSPEALKRGLETGPYGRCVYRSDNDVVDHQVVLLHFTGGLTASLTMQGASPVEGRTLRIDGIRATLFGNEARSELEVHDHRTGSVETLHPVLPGNGRGHGGGDAGVLHDFVQALQTGERQVLTSAADSLVSHLLAFAAEEARVGQRVVEMSAYLEKVGA